MEALAAGLAALGVLFAAWIASHQAFRDLGLRRQLESTDRFLKLVTLLENKDPDRPPPGVGLNEQIAIAWLIAEFGRHDSFLAKSADATIRAYAVSYEEHTALKAELVEALKWLNTKPHRILLSWLR